ncbi:hypothetical protein Taro_024452, partial [Colocasia esculenta]|nr:hypothetical protein [Colocasia esculenta]
MDYRVFMQGLVQAMQTQAHTQTALQAQMEAQEGEMQQYLEEKKASQKRPAATFQRQDKKKAVYQAPQRPVTTSNAQKLLGAMLRGRCACQRLTLGRPENEGVAEAGLAMSCLGLGVDLPAGVAELSSRGTVAGSIPRGALSGRLLGAMLRGRCACQRLTLGRPKNEGVAEAGLAKSCL